MVNGSDTVTGMNQFSPVSAGIFGMIGWNLHGVMMHDFRKILAVGIADCGTLNGRTREHALISAVAREIFSVSP